MRCILCLQHLQVDDLLFPKKSLYFHEYNKYLYLDSIHFNQLNSSIRFSAHFLSSNRIYGINITWKMCFSRIYSNGLHIPVSKMLYISKLYLPLVNVIVFVHIILYMVFKTGTCPDVHGMFVLASSLCSIMLAGC
jgi:predicted membrane protein